MECEYSGQEIQPGEGIMLVRNSGERLYFASSKELKNWEKDRQHDYRNEE